jgi:hypothetical protein
MSRGSLFNDWAYGLFDYYATGFLQTHDLPFQIFVLLSQKNVVIAQSSHLNFEAPHLLANLRTKFLLNQLNFPGP